MVFPSFAILLANGTPRKVSETLLADLEWTSRDPLDVLSPDDVEGRPRLVLPSIVSLIQDVASSMTLADVDRNALIDAMRIAAEKCVKGILGSSRRRHDGHAATLAAQCVAVAPAARREDLSAWLMRLRQAYSRRHAFGQELMRAMESLGVSPPE